VRYMRFLKISIIIVFCFVLFAITNVLVVSATAGEERSVYLSATEYDYPPFSVTDSGKADGFSVELLKAVAEEMGIVVTFEINQWTILKQELADGVLDILPLVGYTEERDLVYDFTVPYIVMRGNIFVRVGDNSILSEEDLFGKEILVLDGDNSQEWAWSIGLVHELTATATYLEAFQLLATGQYDAVLAQGLVGQKLIDDNDLDNVEPVYIYADDGITRQKLNLDGYEQKFCFAVVEDDDELLSILNEGLSIVSQNGTFDELYTKWFPFLIEEPKLSVLDIMLYVGISLVPIVILLLVGYTHAVRKTIKNKTREIENNNRRNEVIVKAFQQDFESDLQRFRFVLNEILVVSDSIGGFMFSRDSNGVVTIRASYSNDKSMKCDDAFLMALIEENEIIQKLVGDGEPILSNNYVSDLNSALTICNQEVKRLMAISVLGIEQTHIVVLLNKGEEYTRDNINQTSILLTGLWTMLERADQLNKVKYMSFYDSLTTLYNRRFFEEEIIRLDNDQNLPITIIMGDVNGLKLINDAFGHSAGDILLVTIAQIIKRNIRENDIAARWGGDEFAIILPNSDIAAAEKLIERIHKETQKASFKYGVASISFGLDTKSKKDDLLSDVFLNAEEMMYHNKIEAVESVRGETIKTIMNTLFEKSISIREHSERVSQVAVSIATCMGLSKTKINDIKTIGMVHDIGKIVIDLNILDKPGFLTIQEREIINQHPSSGSRMLSSSREYSRLVPGVLHHHERIDGKGYPNGLIGDEIPLESRIIAVADSFDAMTATRPYRVTPLTIKEAAQEILDNKGTQFDEEIAEVFVRKVLKIIE